MANVLLTGPRQSCLNPLVWPHPNQPVWSPLGAAQAACRGGTVWWTPGPVPAPTPAPAPAQTNGPCAQQSVLPPYQAPSTVAYPIWNVQNPVQAYPCVYDDSFAAASMGLCQQVYPPAFVAAPNFRPMHGRVYAEGCAGPVGCAIPPIGRVAPVGANGSADSIRVGCGCGCGVRAPVCAPMPLGVNQLRPEAPAALEYNPQAMAEFVATFALQLLPQRCSPAEREEQLLETKTFVQLVLEATRLSKATILFSFVLLVARFCGSPSGRRYAPVSPRDIRVIIAVAFALANKVHDDNTFTSASWSAATGFSTLELNAAELVWLDAVGWSVNVSDVSYAQWFIWEEQWVRFSEDAGGAASGRLESWDVVVAC